MTQEQQLAADKFVERVRQYVYRLAEDNQYCVFSFEGTMKHGLVERASREVKQQMALDKR